MNLVNAIITGVIVLVLLHVSGISWPLWVDVLWLSTWVVLTQCARVASQRGNRAHIKKH